MEIERKFLVNTLPANLSDYSRDSIAQGYISTNPVIRIRQKKETFYLTCKSKGLMAREEFELEISREEFSTLKNKIDHQMIIKERYYIPLADNLKVELDVFKGHLEGLIMAEVEFPSLEVAHAFKAPDWFSTEVTLDHRFHNSYLCQIENVKELIQ